MLALLLALLASLLAVVSPGTASAESIPPLQWPAVVARPSYSRIVTSPAGDVTVGCSQNGAGQDLVTYNAAGALIRQIPRTTQIDGVSNCIGEVVVDKNNVVYGVPYGQVAGGGSAYGPNLLAYDGNTLRWKYPLKCGSSSLSRYAIGGNGNLYATAQYPDGLHLIGLVTQLAAGQTQPAKVLDVKITDDCSTLLLPYRDGIVLRGQNSGVRYYSYGGKLLGTPTVNNPSYSKVNADGRLFDFQYISGSFTSVNVSAYDPRTGAVTWTTPASTSGANVLGATVYPLSGGGVAALVREQKMSAGMPATPTEYVFTLVVLNANGQMIKSVQLPNKNGQDAYGNTILLPDSSGRIALVRDLDVKTTVSNPATVPAVFVAILDANGEQVVGEAGILSGNANAATGPLYGYMMDYAGGNGPVNGLGTLFINARCSGTCGSNTDTKMYPFRVTNFQMDYPRGVVLAANTPAQPAPVPAVALGDSYSSGEGVAPFESGTDTASDKCHRSPLAYARLVARNPNVAATLDTGKFAACSGAETKHVQITPPPTPSPTFNTEPLQVTNLNLTTKVVTITIGGNDIGFVDFGRACILGNCNFSSGVYASTVGAIDNVLPARLESTYKMILQKAPTAQVYVMGYPQVAPVKTVTDPEDIRCSYLYWSGSNGDLSYPAWEDARAARDVVTKLDTKIEQKVNDVRAMNVDNQRLHYVDVNGSGSPFIGHTMCADPGDSYFNNIDPVLVLHPEYALHPNARGQQAYADLAAAAMTP